jgi:hypothetical protein
VLPVGVWEDVTPPALDLGTDAGLVGALAVAVDPLNPATVYTTGDHQGLFRSEDCGATWKKINTGNNASTLDSGSMWVLRIDPVDPMVMYTTPLFGSDQSLFKSTNGGVDWDSITPPGGVVAQALAWMQVQDLAFDPTDHLHIVTTFHVDCVAPHRKVCLGDSKDGGETWTILEGPPQKDGWVEDAGPVVTGAGTVFFGAPFDGLFRTDDGGGSWTQVAPQGYSRFYSSPTGWSYMGSAQNGIYRSRDLTTWTLVPNTITTVGGALIGDGERIFAAARAYVNDQVTSESDGTTWGAFQPPPPTTGATWFEYDSVHHILYSANTNGGLWRLVTH